MAPEPQKPEPDADAETTASATSSIPHRPRTKEDFNKILLDDYVTRDLVHSSVIREAQSFRADYYNRSNNEAEDYRKVRNEYKGHFTPSHLYGSGYSGYGNGWTDGPTRVLYPSQKPRLGHRKTQKLPIKRKEILQQAEQVEELVPIRLDVDWDKIRLRDTFTWNLHDRVISADLFAAQFMEDLGLATPAANPILEQVQQQIREQLNDFYPQVYIEEDALDPELPYSAYKNEEMRILIKLNITIGPTTLEDKFEWELNNPLNSPEEFAQSLSRELSLSGEFTTAIAHSIREQCQLFTRGLYVVGHPFDGRPLEDQDLIASIMPSPLPSVLRPQQQAREFIPVLYEMSEADLERSEVIWSREQRRQKRSVNRRGGPTLPDLKDRQRTVRTLIVSSVIPGAADSVEESRLYKRVASGRKRAGVRDDDLSESSESDEGVPESPALTNLNAGTARTRGMRGAATAAQQRMANIGRSETPEVTNLHHHETRTSARRFGGREREESQEPTSLVVRLKIAKDKLRRLTKELRSRDRPNVTNTPSFTRASSALGTPAPGSMGPPSTPGQQNLTLQPPTTPAAPQSQIGSVDAPPPPLSGPPPAPPSWLTSGLKALLTQYPDDRFEGTMRHTPVNTVSGTPTAQPPAGQPLPDNVKYMFLPRIRCQDCPGKLYTPGPETTVTNFEVHLKNRVHRDRVNARISGNGSQASSAS